MPSDRSDASALRQVEAQRCRWCLLRFPTTYSYDPIGRLSGYQQTYTTTDKNQTVTLAYNAAGQIVGREASNDVFAYGGYVAVKRAYAANGLNHYTTAGPASSAMRQRQPDLGRDEQLRL